MTTYTGKLSIDVPRDRFAGLRLIHRQTYQNHRSTAPTKLQDFAPQDGRLQDRHASGGERLTLSRQHRPGRHFADVCAATPCREPCLCNVPCPLIVYIDPFKIAAIFDGGGPVGCQAPHSFGERGLF